MKLLNQYALHLKQITLQVNDNSIKRRKREKKNPGIEIKKKKKRQDPPIYNLYETHFKYDISRLKVTGWKKIYYTNTNQNSQC